MKPGVKVPARITHQQIADHLGISRVSVTQALHQTRRSTLSPELQARVLEAARQLNYRPRNVATYTIGYVGGMGKLALVGESQYLMEIDEVLREAGYRVLLANAHEDDLDALSTLLTPKTVDGVIFSRWFGGRVRHILPPEIPWIVTSDEDGIGDDVDLVAMDSRRTAADATRYLLHYGHRRIALVTGLGDRHYHGHIKAGIADAFAEVGVEAPSDSIVAVYHDREMREPLLKMMRSASPPTAVITINPEKTVAVLNLLQASGYRVPHDVSLLSLMDSRLFEPLTPQITTTTIGSRSVRPAARRLLDKIYDPLGPARRVLLPGEIIERESVVAPRDARKP